MKITAIETIQLGEFPNLFWLQVHTDEGLVGLGETFFGADAAVAYVHESAAPRLLGQDPLAIDRHSRTLLDTYVGFSSSGAEMRGPVGDRHRALGPVRPGDRPADPSAAGRPVAAQDPRSTTPARAIATCAATSAS